MHSGMRSFVAMQSKFQRWWLYACFTAVLLAGWAGGFSVIVTAVFIAIYLTGVALIGPDRTDDETEDDTNADTDADERSDDSDVATGVTDSGH